RRDDAQDRSVPGLVSRVQPTGRTRDGSHPGAALVAACGRAGVCAAHQRRRAARDRGARGGPRLHPQLRSGARAGRAGLRGGARPRARASVAGAPASRGVRGVTRMTITREQVTEALRDIVDPELGLSVVDLGLIYGVHIDGGRVRVVMTLTAPGCPLHDAISEWVRQAVGNISGGDQV